MSVVKSEAERPLPLYPQEQQAQEQQAQTQQPPVAASEQHKALDLDRMIGNFEIDIWHAQRRGIFGIFHLRWKAWLADKMKEPVIRRLRVEQIILAEQRKTAQAQIDLRDTVLLGERDGELVRAAALQAYGSRLQADEDNRWIGKDERAHQALQPKPIDPPLTVHITNQQIESLALRAIQNIPSGIDGEEELEDYLFDLHERYPKYVADEVEARIRALRRTMS